MSSKRRALFTLLFGAVLACNSDINSGIESANDLLFRKQYVAAERLYRKLLKRVETDRGDDSDRTRLMILDRLGKINAYYLNDHQQAIADYAALVRLYPKTDEAAGARAAVADIYQHKLGKLQSAVHEYEKLLHEFPTHDSAKRNHLKMIQALSELKNFELARLEAEKFIRKWPAEPETTQARFHLANSYYLESRYEEAIAHYQLLLETKPDPLIEALTLFELGNSFQETAEFQRALHYYYACLPSHPNPALVQRKIKRVRQRLSRSQPTAALRPSDPAPVHAPQQP